MVDVNTTDTYNIAQNKSEYKIFSNSIIIAKQIVYVTTQDVKTSPAFRSVILLPQMVLSVFDKHT